MARPREFAIDDALRAAGEVFRTKGYHATSLEDLIEGTGLAKGSLYKAFHDKKSLFMGAFALYAKESRERFRDTLEVPGSPRDAIRQTLIGYVERSRTAAGSAGCLITNSAVELGTQDPELAVRVKESFRKRADLFESAVRRGQAAGEFDPKLDAHSVADFLELTVQGLRVMIKTDPDREQLIRAIDVAMRVLD